MDKQYRIFDSIIPQLQQYLETVKKQDEMKRKVNSFCIEHFGTTDVKVKDIMSKCEELLKEDK